MAAGTLIRQRVAAHRLHLMKTMPPPSAAKFANSAYLLGSRSKWYPVLPHPSELRAHVPTGVRSEDAGGEAVRLHEGL